MSKIIATHNGITITQTHRENGHIWAEFKGGSSTPLAMNYDEDGVKYAYIYDKAQGEVRFEMLTPEEFDKAEPLA